METCTAPVAPSWERLIRSLPAPVWTVSCVSPAAERSPTKLMTSSWLPAESFAPVSIVTLPTFLNEIDSKATPPLVPEIRFEIGRAHV